MKTGLNSGSTHETSEGDIFLVYYLSDEDIVDSKGTNYGKLEIVVGKGKVTHVQDRISTLESDTFESSKKIIKKYPNSSFASLFGSEQVEEESGTPIQLPFRFDPNNSNRLYLVKKIGSE